MDHSPLITKLDIPSSPTTLNTHGSFEAALAQQDDETGILISAAGDNGTVETTVDMALNSTTEMLGTKDVEKVRNVRDVWRVFLNESKVLWAIAAPIAFNIICLYGMNSTTQIFVGHVSNLELSAVAIGLSVVSNFSFGFLVRILPTTILNTHGSFEAALAQQDDETGILISAAGDNGTVETTVDMALNSTTEMLGTKDVEKVRNVRDVWRVFLNESKVLWAIAAPIAFNIICLYGMNSTTQIFVGHVSNLELSAVAIGLSVVSNFSFGFLVRILPTTILNTHGSFEAALAQQDDETGILISAAGDNGTVETTVDMALNSTTEMLGTKDVEKVRNVRDVWRVFLNESKVLWAIAAPIAFNIICLYGMNSTTQIFVGHVSNLELSAVAIGLSVVSNFSFGFLLGMGSALETLCGQAFGAGQVSLLGLYMQRSWIILICSAILLCPLYFFSAQILQLLGQDEEIAVQASRFTIWIIPQMFALAINFLTQKFLQSQSKVMVLAWIGFAALIIHIALLGLFIFGFGWGLVGAALAFDISSWIVSISQVVYVVVWCKDGWTGLSWAAFKDLWAFVKLSLASAVMLCLEIWYMMVLVVLTGHLKDAQIAVDSISICMNINGWEAMLFIGLNAAISVRVSNELGSGRPRATMYAVIVVVVQSLAFGILSMIAILVFRNQFSIIFTNDSELQKAVANIAYLLSITMVLNSIQPVISGVAIGGGWQGLVAYINLGCYYIFGLPFGFVLGYVLNMGVEGIWMGMLCGTAAQTIVLLIVVWRTNWKDEAEKALERVRLWGGQEKQKTFQR